MGGSYGEEQQHPAEPQYPSLLPSDGVLVLECDPFIILGMEFKQSTRERPWVHTYVANYFQVRVVDPDIRSFL